MSNHDLGQFFLDMAMKYMPKQRTQQKIKDFKQNIFNGLNLLYSLQRQTKIEILRRCGSNDNRQMLLSAMETTKGM
jgi:hypothetical protein